mgnify:FL=1
MAPNTEIDLMRNYKFNLVLRGNEIIQAKNNLSLIQNKFIEYIIAKIRGDKSRNLSIQISRKEFAAALGLKEDGYLGRRMLSLIIELMNKSVVVFNSDKNCVDLCKYFEGTYHIGEGYADLEVGKKFASYFLELDGRSYTEYHLKTIMAFQSTHALQLYRLLKQYLHTKEKKRVFDLAEFKFYMNVENSYTKFNMLSKRVIDPSLKEINEISDIAAQYEPKKERGKIIGIIFYIRENLANKSKEVRIKDLYKAGLIDVQATPASETLEKEGIHPLDAKFYGLCFEKEQKTPDNFLSSVRKSYEKMPKTPKTVEWNSYLFGALKKKWGKRQTPKDKETK